MDLFIVSQAPASPMPPTSMSAADRLIGLLQDGRSLERYMEEFVELAFLTNWSDASLNTLFLDGLDESTIRFDEPDNYVSLNETINLILYLNGSEFVVEEVPDIPCFSRPVPPETRVAWPVRQSPSSSTYPSGEPFPCVLPGLQHSKSKRSMRRKRKKAKQPQFPEISASVQPQFPEFSASVQPQFPEFSASVHPQFPEFSASVHPQSTDFSASVQSQFPEFSAANQPKSPVLEEKDWLIDFWVEPAPAAAAEPAAAAAEPSAPSAAAEPSAPSAAAEPSAPAAAAAEPSAPAAAEPTPVARKPFEPLSLPKYFFWGGRVSVGGKDGGGLGDPPWPSKAPDPPWPAKAPDPPWPSLAPDPPWIPPHPPAPPAPACRSPGRPPPLPAVSI
ncbi:uncharacterized protein LOC127506679 [Ctenopharyngodon idella]|uniref:uncharacterized protein LOC127506679 n=1 Tax=Ctenopharyngodon idella TaxID=7959 RepID=UPI002231C41F|nr:uncharacterized protein LOC127506679 [Ctenopharyngodon idella]